MAARSPIEWTDASWTPLRARNRATGAVGWHCEHASLGCARCYSGSYNELRLGTRLPFKPGHRDDVEHFLDERMLRAPLRWRDGRRIFACSMTDLFGAWVPEAWIDRVFAVMALAPRHTFQVLTKRAGRMRAYLSDPDAPSRVGAAQRAIDPEATCYENVGQDGTWPLPNVWLGVSAEDQVRADERVPDLLLTPAAVRFLSAEPLLGPVDLARLATFGGGQLDALRGTWAVAPIVGTVRGPAVLWRPLPRLDLVIAGGESGRDARPMHPDWPRALRDRCDAAGVAFFFKQWGAWAPTVDVDGALRSEGRGSRGAVFEDGRWTTFPRGERHGDVFLVGKAAAGRLLDGVLHDAMPARRPW